jgi:hypothetical protein
VARLDEFSQFGQLYILGGFCKLEKYPKCCRAANFLTRGIDAQVISTKMDWATFWVISFKTHLVTLVPTNPPFILTLKGEQGD